MYGRSVLFLYACTSRSVIASFAGIIHTTCKILANTTGAGVIMDLFGFNLEFGSKMDSFGVDKSLYDIEATELKEFWDSDLETVSMSLQLYF